MTAPVLSFELKKALARPGRLGACRIAAISFLRGLPFFVARRPQTPLRVLCLMAFDTVHVLRYSSRLSCRKLRDVSSLLDFGACLNDCFDGSGFSLQGYLASRQALERSQNGPLIADYTRRLAEFEAQRPPPGGDDGRHRSVQEYRESVVRLSLGTIAGMTLKDVSITNGVRATHCDEDLELLFRIVMLCQIIDDVLDFSTDSANGVPSFLTAHASPSQSLTLTSRSAAQYADVAGSQSPPHLLPFRAALCGVSAVASASLMVGRWRLKRRGEPGEQSAERYTSADAHP